jgi:hypothetical protein
MIHSSVIMWRKLTIFQSPSTVLFIAVSTDATSVPFRIITLPCMSALALAVLSQWLDPHPTQRVTYRSPHPRSEIILLLVHPTQRTLVTYRSGESKIMLRLQVAAVASVPSAPLRLRALVLILKVVNLATRGFHFLLLGL